MIRTLRFEGPDRLARTLAPPWRGDTAGVGMSPSPDGGFIAGWYGDPDGAGHAPEAVKAMCEEFMKISREKYGKA